MKCKIFRYIWCLALVALAACSTEGPLSPAGADEEFARVVGDKVIVNASLELPEMGEINSRAFPASPDYNDLHLYLVEFDDNGSPLLNTLKTVYQPDEETPAADRVNYKFTLTKSNQPRVLHLIAVPKSVEFSFSYEVEAVLIPALKTADGTPAYWRRLSFPSGYVDGDGEPLTTGKGLNQLQHVPLLRNFACVTMTNNAPGFTLTGFAMINVPVQGSVAPWNTITHEFPEFIGEDSKQIDYAELDYQGVMPASTSFINQETAANSLSYDPSDKYMYERPFNSIRHAYAILQGHIDGATKDTFYKIDLGRNNNLGVFQYFNILRNFKYNVVLKSVGTEGYDTALEAANGFVFNNLSFDVVLAPMLNISDGSEVVYVNFTNAVITDPEPTELVFQYRYRALNQTGSSPTYNNDTDVSFPGLEPGDVIDRVEFTAVNGDNGWRDVKIYCKAAGVETKTQTFSVVKKSGLGRQVNLILHRKWTLGNPREYPGLLENWSATTPGLGTASALGDQDLTIFFDIPDNLQESMFPLVFTLESDHQNIENNPQGMLVVTYGTSSFNGVEGFTDISASDRRIKYERTVTWTDYNDPLTSNPYENGTAIDNGNGTFTHRVRCRFRTITDLNNFDDISQSHTTVIITNPNFNNAFVEFDRKQ